MTNRRSGATKVVASVLLGFSALVPSPLLATERVCSGTLLQVKVIAPGMSRSDRFRFSLGLDAENAKKDAVMTALNVRLVKSRQAIPPLALGPLTVHAPRSYAVGGGLSGTRLELASTNITGELSHYDALI